MRSRTVIAGIAVTVVAAVAVTVAAVLFLTRNNTTPRSGTGHLQVTVIPGTLDTDPPTFDVDGHELDADQLEQLVDDRCRRTRLSEIEVTIERVVFGETRDTVRTADCSLVDH